MKLSKRSIYIICVVVLTIAIDQLSKVLVRLYIDPNDQIQIIGEYFTLMNVENSGAFLGMGSDFNPVLRILLLLVLPVLVLAYVVRYVVLDHNLDNWSLFAYCSIIGGGIANVFDRIAYGSVTDFLYVKLTDLLRTGIFNLADLSVSTGIIMLFYISFRNKKEIA